MNKLKREHTKLYYCNIYVLEVNVTGMLPIKQAIKANIIVHLLPM